jgi:riboflavin kinase/FMN adenylyltransferase
LRVVHALSGETSQKSSARGAAIALGNFDGLHKGHQAVIAAARAAGAALGAPLGAAVFDPHPRRFFAPDAEPFRIMSDSVRDRLVEQEQGVEILYRIPFDQALSSMDDRAFARMVLAEDLGVAHVAVGADYRFGRDRVGDAESLARLGRELGFGVSVVGPVGDGGTERVSSSAIRAAIRDGDMAEAARLMTRPWIVDGVVERGGRRGHAIGFPTANMSLGELVRPKLGVYAVTARIDGETEERLGVANIGRRPTFGGDVDERLETHLFDFKGDLYGRRVEVSVRHFIREERKFSGLEALKTQIAADVEKAGVALSA